MGESINPKVQLRLGAGLDSIRSALGKENDVFVFANLREDQVAQPDGKARNNLAYVFLATDQQAFEDLMQGTPEKGAFARQRQDFLDALTTLEQTGSSARPDNAASPLRSCCSSSTHLPVVAIAEGNSATVTALDVSVRITSTYTKSKASQDADGVTIRKIDEIALDGGYIPGDGDV
jgi:hypothetical protein